MPEYQFEDVETGELLESSFSMADAPSIGSIVSVDGRRLRRLVSDCQLNTNPVSGRYPFASNTLPRWLPGCDHTHKGRKGSKGKPIIQSKEHEKRICEEHGYVKES